MNVHQDKVEIHKQTDAMTKMNAKKKAFVKMVDALILRDHITATATLVLYKALIENFALVHTCVYVVSTTIKIVLCS